MDRNGGGEIVYINYTDDPEKSGNWQLPIKKRKIDEDCSPLPRKKAKSTDDGIDKENGSSTSAPADSCTENDIGRLITLPDDVLLIVLQFLDHASLVNLLRTCCRFEGLCQDYTLWKNVRFLWKPADSEDLSCIAQNVTNDTVSVRILGQDSGPTEDCPHWLTQLFSKCHNLSDLALPHHSFHCPAVPIKSFPKTLTRLDLSHSNFRNLAEDVSYFRDISIFIPGLVTLILTGCDWFVPHSLMAISKCPNLQELYLNDCVQVTECLAYTGLSCRGGFKKLSTLDLRNCCLSFSELSSFVGLEELRRVYLQNPPHNECLMDTNILFNMTLVRENNQGQKAASKVEKFVFRNFKGLSMALVERFTNPEFEIISNSLTYLDLIGTDISPITPTSFTKVRPEITVVTDWINQEKELNLNPS